MVDSRWFFKQGNQEHGPVSSADLKALTASGELQANDLVRKEGREDWVAANEIRGLFSAPQVSQAFHSPPEATDFTGISENISSAATSDLDSNRGFDLLDYFKTVGQPLLLVGLVMVLSAKGCEGINAKYVATLEINASQAESAERDVLRKSADKARASLISWGLWRECIFVLGTIVLSIGLIATGFSGDAAARWICLTMVGIIIFSIYVGGVAWLVSLLSMLPAMR